jgi:hypothetical protein
MGAGALFAAERERWPEHWRVADLELESDVMLAFLDPTEEVRAVVPALRSTPRDGTRQALICVTDRRVVMVARDRAGSESLRVEDVTGCVGTVPREARVVAHDDGHVAFDVDEASIVRMWTTIDALVV